MSEAERNDPIIQPVADPLVGRSLAGRYEILGLLGEGGMGRVYHGRQRTLDRSVAIKCIHPHLLSSEPVVVRFLEEARVASQIIHPNIVKIYDFGRTLPPDPTTLFLVMERLSGPDLASVIAKAGPLPLVRVRSIVLQILSALGEAHARGVTHRDAKPDNVILEPTVSGCERAKLIDFGIAKVHGAPGVTAVGQFIGTPCYMPPEQIRGEKSEVSSDLYSVGVTLFQMITGRLPFHGGTLMAVLEQQLYAKRPDPRDVAPSVECPASLAAVCMRAIDADAKNRFETADLFAEALEASFAEVLPTESRRSPYAAPPQASDDALSRAATEPPPSFAVSPVRPSAPPPADLGSGHPEYSGPAKGWGRPPTSRGPLRGWRPPPPPGFGGVDLGVAEDIERQVDRALAEGELERAERALRRGVELGEAWLDSDEREAGEAALAGFGRKLGIVLRQRGLLDDSEDALNAALAHAEEQDGVRARVLVELVATLGDLGRVTEAEAYRLEALRIATGTLDRELTARLRRQAQSLALGLTTLGAAPPAREPRPRSHSSDFRMKAEHEQHERVLRRR